MKGIVVMIYRQMPDELTTSITYGLSRTGHPEWVHGKPELAISVRSDDDSWGLAIGYLAEKLRGECFRYGDTINFGTQISPESAMAAFLVFAPAVLDRADLRADVSLSGHEGHDIINIAGMYPIHDTERRFIQQNGLPAFIDLEWDPYDVTRPPAA